MVGGVPAAVVRVVEGRVRIHADRRSTCRRGAERGEGRVCSIDSGWGELKSPLAVLGLEMEEEEEARIACGGGVLLLLLLLCLL